VAAFLVRDFGPRPGLAIRPVRHEPAPRHAMLVGAVDLRAIGGPDDCHGPLPHQRDSAPMPSSYIGL